MTSKKNSSDGSTILMHEFHVTGSRVSLRASKSFVSLVRSKMIHGEAFGGIEDIDEVGNGWYHLIPSGTSSSGGIRSSTDRELVAAFAANDLQDLVNELLKNEAKAETFQTTKCGRNRVVVQLAGRASSAQRDSKDQRTPEQKLASRGKVLKLQAKFGSKLRGKQN